MKINNWLLLLCALVWAGSDAYAQNQAANQLAVGVPPTDAALAAARVFDEPLIPMNAGSSPQENQALSAALAAYGQRTTADNCTSLANFADSYPQSRWTAPLLLHLGVEYYNYGYYSKALDAWQRSWGLFKEVHSGPAKPEADRALGELARMYSKLGRISELSALLTSCQERNLDGPGTQLVHDAQEGLWLMENKPAYAFGCGPSALDRILLRTDPAKAGNPYLLECTSSTNGFSLARLAEISAKLGMNYQMAYREPQAGLIVPAVVHWKVGHYAAIVEQRDDHILVQDYTFRGTVWMSTNALSEEGSGYYLVPPGRLPPGWRTVASPEGQMIWGKGQTGGRDAHATDCRDKKAGGDKCKNCKPGCGGMTTYTMNALLTSLVLEDTPLHFYTPFGPQVDFTTTYNQLEANQPAIFSYSNLGPKWDFNWLSFIIDNPAALSADISLYDLGGGTLDFNNFNPATQSFSLEAMSESLLVRLTTNSYELRFSDGSRREFQKSDGATGSTRRIFLTQVIDPFGNTVLLNYDSQFRITNVVNAIGQAMTLSYTNSAYPFQVTSVTDPFGRSAQLLYDTNGMLVQITDALGLTSQYAYGTNQFIKALITPYGTTTFTTGNTNGGAYLTATDPLGGTEAMEYSQALPVPHSLPASDVPHGLSTFNLFIDARDSFYWDKKAFAEGAWDWSKSHIYHWLHQSPNGANSARILESEKEPLEARIWFNYPGQSTNFGAPYYLDAAYTGAGSAPTVVASVLDDGTTQISLTGYNSSGNVTNIVDPMGRTFTLIYGTNNLDVLQARMTRGGKNELMRQATYNQQHEPLTLTDAAGQTTTMTYNSQGQVLTITDARQATTTFTYSNGFLVSIQLPVTNSNNTATFTYDAFNRVQTATDTEGYTVIFGYDSFDRITTKTFPDGTYEQVVYDRLDIGALRDRGGHWTTNSFDANRQLTSVRDPLGQTTRFIRCKCGLLDAIIDPMGRTTSWTYDIESRPVSKTYPDGSVESYTYESNSGRLHSRTDANGQQTVTEYYPDNNVKSVSYSGGPHPLPPVSYTYDSNYSRVVTMQDVEGTTTFSYNPITPVPALGASLLSSVAGPLPNSTITYQYDELGRVVSRAINGVAETFAFDTLGRATNMNNALGSFKFAFVNVTTRLLSIGYPNGQTTAYAYYDNAGDQRLKQIMNLKPNSSLLSAWGYAYNSVSDVTAWTNSWDTLPTRVRSFTYDDADQLSGAVQTDGALPLGTNSYTYDPAGNRTQSSDSGTVSRFDYNALNQVMNTDAGLTNATYEWDAANRLSAINFGTHRTEFSYDGLDRRYRCVEKENGVVVADNYFLWSGGELREERDSSGGQVVRRFFTLGESVIGTGVTNLFYTRDHLGSIRDTTGATGALLARYDYDPYGRQTILAETLAPSVAFTGLFQHKPSGLDLAVFRTYDPHLGRWLNRDPIEAVGSGLNFYAYVDNNPVNDADPLGLCGNSCNSAAKDVRSTAWKNYTGTSEQLRVLRYLEQVEALEGGVDKAGNFRQAFQKGIETTKTGNVAAISLFNASLSTIKNVSEDLNSGTSASLTALDGLSTFGSSYACSAVPAVGAVNLVTGGGASALVNNGAVGAAVIVKMGFKDSRFTTADQDAIQRMMTRNWLTCALWKGGEAFSDWLFGTPGPKPCR